MKAVDPIASYCFHRVGGDIRYGVHRSNPLYISNYSYGLKIRPDNCVSYRSLVTREVREALKVPSEALLKDPDEAIQLGFESRAEIDLSDAIWGRWSRLTARSTRRKSTNQARSQKRSRATCTLTVRRQCKWADICFRLLHNSAQHSDLNQSIWFDESWVEIENKLKFE